MEQSEFMDELLITASGGLGKEAEETSKAEGPKQDDAAMAPELADVTVVNTHYRKDL